MDRLFFNRLGGVGLAILAGALVLVAPAPGLAAEKTGGSVSAGGALGFLGNTPDGTAFALNFHGDLFVNRQVSMGPLLQFAVTGDLNQVGLSAQAKYWIVPFEKDKRLKLAAQAGIGFIHADHFNDDTSFLIPLGIGLDFQVNQALAVNATFLINFTDLDTAPGNNDDTTVMPGLSFGVRF